MHEMISSIVCFQDHCMTGKHSSSQFGTVYTEKKHLKCQLCNSLVVHSYDSLKSHVGTASHGNILPRDYFVMYIHGKEEDLDDLADVGKEIQPNRCNHYPLAPCI